MLSLGNDLSQYDLSARCKKKLHFSFDFSRVFLITQLRRDARPHPFLVAEKVSAGCAAGAYEHSQIGKSELGGCTRVEEGEGGGGTRIIKIGLITHTSSVPQRGGGRKAEGRREWKDCLSFLS